MIRRLVFGLLGAAALLPLSGFSASSARAQEGEHLWWFSHKTIVSVQMMGQGITGGPVSEELARKALTFASGATLFTALHEVGHMLVSELNIPVLGKEEDAVDTFATVILLLAQDPRFDRAVRDAANEWWLSHELSAGQGYEFPFYAEHSPSKARAANMACLAVGHRPDDFRDYADTMGIPRDRQDRCYWDWQQAYDSWERVLDSGYLPDTSPPRTNYTLVYDDLPPASAYLRRILEESTIMETVSEVVVGGLAIPNHITFRSGSCGQANAFWSPRDREVTMCYELVEGFLELIFLEQSKWRSAAETR